MYEVPLTEESCSSTETKIAQKLTEDLCTDDHKLSQLHNQEKKEGKL